jgi:AcrR family transcriptional regulator
MPRPTEATREEVASETRQRLLDAAAEEFAREGYVGANINRISQAAGFAKGTVYNYFPSKHALMLALIDETAAAHVDFVLRRVEAEPDPVRRLKQFFGAGFAFVERNPARARVIISALYGPDDEFKTQVYEAYKLLLVTIAQDILDAGVAGGDFRPIDRDVVTALLMTVYLGSCSQLGPGGKIWLDPSQVTTFALDGIRLRERPRDDEV